MSSQRIGFIGAGQMARALARGFVQAGLVTADALCAFDISEAAAASFTQTCGGRAVATNAGVIADSDLVFLAVKPQYIPEVLDEIASSDDASKLFVSIAAGVTLQQFETALPASRVIRVMPNTPCLVGAGASAFARGSRATEDDAELIRELLGAIGVALEVPEAQLDAVTGLSGSGPAFVYVAIEALSDGGVRAGLPRDVATRLAAQTVFGAAKMVLDTNEHPAVLKDRVASPAGTTIAGLAGLEAAGFRDALIDAVQRATDRSRELGR